MIIRLPVGWNLADFPPKALIKPETCPFFETPVRITKLVALCEYPSTAVQPLVNTEKKKWESDLKKS